ncbi:MAG: Cytochrome c554 [Chlorobi bacterium OLB5]|nr:MAG: Cytochrome c554 [Chlorobi bacterium OLB5]
MIPISILEEIHQYLNPGHSAAINLFLSSGWQGPWSVVWNFRTGLVGLNQTSSEIPSSFKLYDNYPNPFNPVTNIKFDIPKSSYVKINIYDASGRLVTELVNQYLNAGSYVSQFTFSEYSSGVYYYRIESGSFTDVKKMILVK